MMNEQQYREALRAYVCAIKIAAPHMDCKPVFSLARRYLAQEDRHAAAHQKSAGPFLQGRPARASAPGDISRVAYACPKCQTPIVLEAPDE